MQNAKGKMQMASGREIALFLHFAFCILNYDASP
jgi:hypothetical protein